MRHAVTPLAKAVHDMMGRGNFTLSLVVDLVDLESSRALFFAWDWEGGACSYRRENAACT